MIRSPLRRIVRTIARDIASAGQQNTAVAINQDAQGRHTSVTSRQRITNNGRSTVTSTVVSRTPPPKAKGDTQ
jgi:hypothetical protein